MINAFNVLVSMVKLWFPLEIAYLNDSLQINFIISSVKNFSNKETGGSTVSSTGSVRVYLKPVGSETSEWILLWIVFLSPFCFLDRRFVAVSSLYPTTIFPLRHFISNTTELRSWLPLRSLASAATVFSSSESASLLGLLEFSGGWR